MFARVTRYAPSRSPPLISNLYFAAISTHLKIEQELKFPQYTASGWKSILAFMRSPLPTSLALSLPSVFMLKSLIIRTRCCPLYSTYVKQEFFSNLLTCLLLPPSMVLALLGQKFWGSWDLLLVLMLTFYFAFRT